jgi:hypothetical protein
MPVTAYTVTAPATPRGKVTVASGNFTVTLGTGDPGGTVVFTPAASPANGAFTPTTLSLTNATRSGTFTFTPAVPGVYAISVANNGSITPPADVAYTGLSAPDDAHTVIKNTSGKRMTFSFIGRRGITLASNATYQLRGGPYDSPDLRQRPRDIDDFIRALDRGHLDIISSPALFLRDATTASVKKVTLNNGTFGTKDPSWGAHTES